MNRMKKYMKLPLNKRNRNGLSKLFVISLLSAALVVLMDLSLRDFKLVHSIQFLSNNWKVFALSTIVVGLIMMVFLVVLNNMIIVLGSITLAFVLFSLSNYIKIQLRAEPIIPSDIGSLKALPDLLRMVEFKYLIIFVVLTFSSLYLIYRLNKLYKIYLFKKDLQGISFRIFITVISIMSTISITNVHAQNNSFRKGINLVGFNYYRGSTLLSYQANSYVLSFIDSLPGPAMIEPIQYSKNEVYEVLEKYQEGTDERNKNKTKDNFEDISVIYILSESLSDPRVIEGTNLEESPIPYIQDISDKNMAGKAIVPVYGGGTPNSEFELLTGLSIQNLKKNMSIPYQKVLPYKKNFPNFVRDFKRDNVDSVSKAIHSYNSRLFKRRDVFPILGFDEMYFEDDMNHQYSVDDDNRISDAALYEEALDHLNQDSKTQFLHLLSMQNHSSYEDVYRHYDFEPSTGDKHLDELLKYYLQGIYITDQETEKFINEIESMNRKVAVVLYGDHHPGIYSSLINKTDKFSLYTTDFFIYTNFNETKIESDEPVSLTNLNNYLYDLADVKTNAIHQLIWDLRQEIIAGVDDDFLLNNNQVLKYQELSKKQQELLNDYHLIQYDIIEGNSYSQQYIKENGW